MKIEFHLSRRDFLKVTTGSGAAIFLASCNPKKSAPERNFYPCSPDYLIENLDQCVEPGQPEDLHLAEILAAVENSTISGSGNNRLRDIIIRAEDILQQPEKVVILKYKKGITGGTARVIIKELENGQNKYWLFIKPWKDSIWDVEERIHELTHIVWQKEELDLGHDFSQNWEGVSEYYGNLAGIAWAQSKGISPSYFDTEYSTQLFSITDTLDKAELSPFDSNLYLFYSDLNYRYTSIHKINSARELLATIDEMLALLNENPDRNLKKIEDFKAQKTEVTNYLLETLDEIKTTEEKWRNPEWNQKELEFKNEIDSKLIPPDFYSLDTSTSVLRYLTIFLDILTPDVTLTEAKEITHNHRLEKKQISFVSTLSQTASLQFVTD